MSFCDLDPSVTTMPVALYSPPDADSDQFAINSQYFYGNPYLPNLGSSLVPTEPPASYMSDPYRPHLSSAGRSPFSDSLVLSPNNSPFLSSEHLPPRSFTSEDFVGSSFDIPPTFDPTNTNLISSVEFTDFILSKDQRSVASLSPAMSAFTSTGSFSASSLPGHLPRAESNFTTRSSSPSFVFSPEPPHPHARVLGMLELTSSPSPVPEMPLASQDSPLPQSWPWSSQSPLPLPLPANLMSSGVQASEDGLILPVSFASGNGAFLDWDQLAELAHSPEVFNKLKMASRLSAYGLRDPQNFATHRSSSSSSSQSDISDTDSNSQSSWGLSNISSILSHMIGDGAPLAPVQRQQIPRPALEQSSPDARPSSSSEREKANVEQAPVRPNSPNLDIHLATDDMVVYWCPELDAPVKDEVERKRKLGQKSGTMRPLVKIRFTSATYHKVFDKETGEEVFPYSGKGPGNDWIRGQALGIVKCTCTFNCLGTRSEDYFKRPSVLRKHFASCTSRHTNHPLRVLCKFQREAESLKTEGKSFGPRKKPSRRPVA